MGSYFFTPNKILSKGGRKLVKIVFKNGRVAVWTKEEYNDYKYDGKCFILIKDGQWIGFYNMDSVTSITIK